jgi:3-methylcrotonyl-CoA carboxylase alpha subunit
MKIEFQKNEVIISVELERDSDKFSAKVRGRLLEGRVLRWEEPFFALETGQAVIHGAIFKEKDYIDIHLPEGNFRLKYPGRSDAGPSHGHPAGGLTSPMPGKVVQVLVKEGQKVVKGELLMILEAMKMEHRIVSPKDGVVEKIFFKEGELVAQEVELVGIGNP